MVKLEERFGKIELKNIRAHALLLLVLAEVDDFEVHVGFIEHEQEKLSCCRTHAGA